MMPRVFIKKMFRWDNGTHSAYVREYPYSLDAY